MDGADGRVIVNFGLGFAKKQLNKIALLRMISTLHESWERLVEEEDGRQRKKYINPNGIFVTFCRAYFDSLSDILFDRCFEFLPGNKRTRLLTSYI